MRPHRTGVRAAFSLVVLSLLYPVDTPAASVTARGARIVEVTVFPDRAEVVQEVQVEVPAGSSTVEFLDLPLKVEPDSLRVTAKGVAATLGAVELRTRADEPEETPEHAAAQSEVRRIEAQIASLDVEDQAARELKEFLKSLRAAVAQQESGKLVEGRASFQTIASVYGFMQTKLVEIGSGELERREKRTDLARQLGVAQAKLRAARPAGTIQRKVATLEIEVQKAGSLDVRLAYVVPDAYWRPAYRASLDAATGEVHLVSEGVVRQATGEDWRGVSLRLSTAAPARGVNPPVLSVWYLRVERLVALGGFANVREKDSYDEMERAAVRTHQNMLTLAPGKADALPEEPASTQTAAVIQSAYNVAFDVPGRSEVPADGSDHRVVLRQETLSGQLEYRAVPALAPSAYLVVKTKAPSGYPLLAGPARVFAGSAYLGSFGLEETGPGEEVTLPFGVDNRLKVERVRLPQERSQEGFIGKDRRIAHAFRTKVKNLRDGQVTVILEERVPVSEDERIEVEKGKGTSPGWREVKDRPGILEWTVGLAPGEEKEITLEYAVRFPKDLVVPGLE